MKNLYSNHELNLVLCDNGKYRIYIENCDRTVTLTKKELLHLTRDFIYALCDKEETDIKKKDFDELQFLWEISAILEKGFRDEINERSNKRAKHSKNLVRVHS